LADDNFVQTFPPEYPRTEIIIGLVGPLGTNLGSVEETIKERLEVRYGYAVDLVRISHLLRGLGWKDELMEADEYARYDTYMKAGSDARRKAGRGDLLALAAANEIKARRTDGAYRPSTAHILRALKHPGEVDALRTTYGSGFFLIGAYSPKAERLKCLTSERAIGEKQAEELIQRDEEEPDELGQRTRDTFEKADAFVALHQDDWKQQLWRILELIFGNPHLSPTPEEHAMFMAYSASLRSADLSRQVGAVIARRSGEIIATGANDVPRCGGGLYWPKSNDCDDQRDHVVGYDSNAKRRDEIVLAVMRALRGDGEAAEDLLAEAQAKLRETGLYDLTEFGRAVHAEMEALLSAARIGVSLADSTLYSTTFPCHNCAKHIVASGIRRVVYVEPYPKSLAAELHSDSIEIDPVDPVDGRVAFTPFVGIGPRRFFDLFSMRLSNGRAIKRKDKKGHKADWQENSTAVRIPLLPISYLEREKLAAMELDRIIGGNDGSPEETES
jgi:deoxycytidylate deaminase